MKKCKVCGKKTTCGVDINFKLVPLCDDCATQVTMQQVSFWEQHSRINLKAVQKESDKNV